jgi:hypothetical protein
MAMTDVLAEFFDQFSSEEQAFIRAKQAEAKIILLQGQAQDEAPFQAAATEFVGYQRVLSRRIDPVCTESVEWYLRQLDRICEGILAKYGRWECKDAIAEMRAEAERLAWISLGKQLGSARTGTTSAASEPEQPQADVDNGTAPARATAVARSAEDIIPKAAPTPAVQRGPAAGEPARVLDEATPAQPATVATGGKGGAPWHKVEICFLDAEHAQVTALGQVRELSYAEMGFGDRRGMKVGDRGPNKAWGWLRKFAEERGTIDLPERQRAPVPKGPRDAERQPRSSHEVLVAERAGAAKARADLHVAMKGLRGSLCSYFGIKDNPILFEETCYRAQFQIGCSPSYHQ